LFAERIRAWNRDKV